MSMSLEMEIRSKRLHRHPASSELAAKHGKKKLKIAPSMVFQPPVVASPATDLSTPTPSAPAPKDKGKAPATTPEVHRSPRFTLRDKILAGSICAAKTFNTSQHLPKRKL